MRRGIHHTVVILVGHGVVRHHRHVTRSGLCIATEVHEAGVVALRANAGCFRHHEVHAAPAAPSHNVHTRGADAAATIGTVVGVADAVGSLKK